MVKERMDLLELMRKRGVDGDVDFLREALRVLVEEIMEADVSSRTGAGYGERNPERVTQRNGYRSRAWDTRVGTMELQIPKLREGSYFPSLLEPRRRSERALLAVIQQAYVEGVSTRRVDDLVKALGCEGISKSQVSRICQELDGVVESFLGRPLDGGPYPYLWLDALTQKVREAGRIGVAHAKLAFDQDVVEQRTQTELVDLCPLTLTCSVGNEGQASTALSNTLECFDVARIQLDAFIPTSSVRLGHLTCQAGLLGVSEASCMGHTTTFFGESMDGFASAT